MLEGIEILSKTEILVSPNWVEPTIGILLGLLLLFSIIGQIAYKADNKIGILCASIVDIICLIGFFVVSIVAELNPKHTGKYEYQVTIDDSVSMTEFYEKYEVIDIEGKIYTIKIKEVDND